MQTNDASYRATAIDAIGKRDFERAGDAYTRAAWQTLAESRPDRSPFDIDTQGWVGEGLAALLRSALCYRVIGQDARARARGIESVAIAQDLQTRCDRPVQRACLSEFVADSRLVGDLADPDSAYEQAADQYRAAGDQLDDPHSWTTTPLFEAAAGPFQQAARGPADGEIAVSWETLHGPDPDQPGAFLAHRATYKRQRFPSVLEQCCTTGTLAAPRGSTEYDTDHHQCPHCGSTAVNWVAESVLCLRCSRPTTPQ